MSVGGRCPCSVVMDGEGAGLVSLWLSRVSQLFVVVRPDLVSSPFVSLSFVVVVVVVCSAKGNREKSVCGVRCGMEKCGIGDLCSETEKSQGSPSAFCAAALLSAANLHGEG